MHKYSLLSILVFLVTVQPIQAQDTIFIEGNSSELLVSPSQTGLLLKNPGNNPSGRFRNLNYVPLSQIDDSTINWQKALYFRFIIKNETENILPVSISKNAAERMEVLVFDEEGKPLKLDKTNVRGMVLHGNVMIPAHKVKEVYARVIPGERSIIRNSNDLNFKVFNYTAFIEGEMRGRLVDSLLIGLLIFSAVLNLIIGIILKKNSFVALFFYLSSLVLFSVSFLGFYDEMISSRNIHLPIALPSYILTLVLFLFVSKYYLELEKNLPTWNTFTNLIMFFLILSIPYYYLTVYVQRFYNEFLAFSSLMFFIIAAFVGFIESLLLLKKEPKARFFLTANIIILISLMVNIFLDNKYPVVIGSVLQGFIFTIGLAAEIKLLDNQKHKFQLKYTNQLELNLRLKDKVTLELEKKVEERTKELKYTNKELNKKNQIVEEQKQLLLIRSRNIKKSIEYAKRIQSASFPSPKIIERITSDYFIFYKPRDIVSGDFYWFGEVSGKVIIIAADCTGHGVPGAFMSMYGIAFLNEIVSKDKIYQPDQILNNLRDKISSSLNRGDNEFETMDGMDMAVVTLDTKSNKVMFAGANNPLYFVRDRVIEKIEPDKMPVAFFQKMEPFHVTEFESHPGDSIFIFTDGIVDQFGGEQGKKFLNKRFRDLLIEISDLPMKKQHQQVGKAFTEWKRGHSQLDDVLVIGFRLE